MVFSGKKIITILKEEKIAILILLLSTFLIFYNLDGRLMSSDELLFATRSADILNKPVAMYFDLPPTYFYLVALIYKVFGVSTYAARILSAFSSILTLLIVYLAGKKLFSKKTGLASAAVLGFSLFFLNYSGLAYNEQLSALLFTASAYFLLVGIKENKSRMIYVSIAIAAFSVLVKQTGFLFFIVVFLFVLWKRKLLSLRMSRFALFSAVILLVFASPIIAFNYMLYSTYGILDFQFSRALHLNVPAYGLLYTYNVRSTPSAILYGLSNAFITMFQLDKVFFPLAFLAVIFALLKERKNLNLSLQFMMIWLLSFVILFSSYADTSGGNAVFGASVEVNWFITIIPAAALLSGVFLSSVVKSKVILILVLVFIAGFSVGSFSSNLYVHDTQPFNQLRAYLASFASANQTIVVDNKVYAGYWGWYLYDKCAVRNIGYEFASASDINSMQLVIVKFDGNNLGWAQPQESGLKIPTNSSPDDVILSNGIPFFEIYRVNAVIDPSSPVDCSRLKTGYEPKTISK